LLLALALVPVLLVDIPAMNDYPNHLARMHLLSTAAADNSFYRVEWNFNPYQAMDLAVPLMARLMGIEPATIYGFTIGMYELWRIHFRLWQMKQIVCRRLRDCFHRHPGQAVWRPNDRHSYNPGRPPDPASISQLPTAEAPRKLAWDRRLRPYRDECGLFSLRLALLQKRLCRDESIVRVAAALFLRPRRR
jgi:hypothetical protein